MSFRFLTAGESHGKALIGILEGLPSGIPVCLEALQQQMKRRKLGVGRGARQAIETDQIEVLSGLRFGKTLGSPLALCLWNQDWENWKHLLSPAAPTEKKDREKDRSFSIPRPGHADWAGGIKYQHQDLRNVLERASARETAMRVALGSVARQLCEHVGITFGSHVLQIGRQPSLPQPLPTPLTLLNHQADASPTRTLDTEANEQWMKEIEEAKTKGETLGGCFEVCAEGLPVGLGSYVHWDRRLDAKLGQAFLGLHAIKGVEIGEGIALSQQYGSQAHDSYDSQGNRNFFSKGGGIEGGMSTGSLLRVRAHMKPLSTLQNPLMSCDLMTGKPGPAHRERSDVCAVPAAAVIGEALLALVLTELLLEKFGGDSFTEFQTRVLLWKKTPL